MRTLHVAALPFPSPQGTQALLHQMLSVLGERGHDTHLLCYAHGAQSPRALAPDTRAYTIHRAPTRSFTRSLRSGPSLDKVWLDVGLGRELACLCARLSPDLIVAHHVEAAACALALRGRRVLFVAHTSLAEELPTYVPAVCAPLVRTLGAAVDRCLTHCSPRTAAVSPLLAELLGAHGLYRVDSLPLPWALAAPIARDEALAARATLGLAGGEETVLYAGNLDAYQGLPVLLAGLALAARGRPALRVLIATESDPRPLQQQLRARGLTSSTTFLPLADEPARRRAFAAADCALVPRQSAGGVPVKLLDALARGVPVVASRTALAGYALEEYCACVDEPTAAHWAEAISRTLAARDASRTRATRARAYIERRHGGEQFVQAIERYAEAPRDELTARSRSTW